MSVWDSELALDEQRYIIQKSCHLKLQCCAMANCHPVHGNTLKCAQYNFPGMPAWIMGGLEAGGRKILLVSIQIVNKKLTKPFPSAVLVTWKLSQWLLTFLIRLLSGKSLRCVPAYNSSNFGCTFVTLGRLLTLHREAGLYARCAGSRGASEMLFHLPPLFIFMWQTFCGKNLTAWRSRFCACL